MATVTTVFDKVKAHRTRRFVCEVCGRRATRSATFTHTINPFNRNENGQVKTWQEVNSSVQAEADRWEPTKHAGCED